MTNEEMSEILKELEGFCNRNMGNKLSTDLCEVIFFKVRNICMNSIAKQAVTVQTTQGE